MLMGVETKSRMREHSFSRTSTIRQEQYINISFTWGQGEIHHFKSRGAGILADVAKGW